MTDGWHPTQAIGPDGERADVKDVANGLQCRCLCYECGQPVFAKQGLKVRWHFAHHAPTNCRPTPVSELHFFAKTLLAEKLWLWIPAVQAKAAERTEPISDRQRYRFSGVKVEKADGNVRPDLLLVTDRGKVLHVEIYVRHRVDPIKLEKLRGRGICSIEIDLSKLDWDDRGAWNDAILETALREWLHNARAAKVEQGIEVQAASEANAKQQVLDAEQGDRLSKRVRTGDALAYVRDLIWPGLNRISKETSARMQQDFPAYQDPWHVVHSYLKWLKDQHWMFSKRVGGKQWLPSSSAVHLREEKEGSWQLERERKEEVTDWLDMILSDIPENETSSFDRADWVDWFVTSYDEDDARAFHGAISGIVVSGRQLADDFRGLPLLAEYERQVVAQKERRVQKERERDARLAQLEQDRRISAIEGNAPSMLGELAQHWLLAANAQLDGKSPLNLATQSDEGLARATSELARLHNERREAEARETAKMPQQVALEKNRVELAALAGKRARDPARAEL